MKTYIFPYTLDDGSVELYQVNAGSPEDAIKAFHFTVGAQTEPVIRYIALPANTAATTIRLDQQKAVS